MANRDLSLGDLKHDGFVPGPRYDARSDSLFFWERDAEYYGERIDSILTVYRDLATDAVIGFQLKGLASALRAHHRGQLRWLRRDYRAAEEVPLVIVVESARVVTGSSFDKYRGAFSAAAPHAVSARDIRRALEPA